MATVASQVIDTRPPLALFQRALVWAGAAVVAMPTAVLLHELGHRLAQLYFGFAGSTLHYSSTTYARERVFWELVYRGDLQSAAGVAPVWQVATTTAAGLLVTYLVVFACCFVAARYRPHPLVVALGVVSALRFLSGVPTLQNWFSGKPIRPGTDEVNLALLTGLPEVVLAEVGLFLLAAAWFWLVRSIPRGQRALAAGGLAAGTVAGFMLYFRLVGPLLLP
jgi:hypothetical protein